MTDEFIRPAVNLIHKITLLRRLFVNLVKTYFHHDLPITLVVYAIVAISAVFYDSQSDHGRSV